MDVIKAQKFADKVDGLDVKKKLLGELEKEDEEPDIFDGLTERQKVIQRLVLRKFSQRAIAQALNLSPALVNREIAKIKKLHLDKGTNVDASTIGEAITVYEEVESRAWEVYQSADTPQMRLKALETVMKARAQHLSTLSDMGLINSTKSNKEEQEATALKLLEKWESSVKTMLIEKMASTMLSPLPEPTPPEPPQFTPLEEPAPPSDDEQS